MASKINSIAVLGAGTMGQGIAQVCAMAGYQTFLYDIDLSLSQKAIDSIGVNFDNSILKRKSTEEEKQKALSRLAISKELSDLKVDLIIEAVVEKLDVKQKLFAELEKLNKGNCILATNTSSISITQIASGLKNPGKCVGLHFFNPAALMKLVEVIGGVKTNHSVISDMKAFVLSLNKIAVEAKDSPGFIVNRVARHYYVEALKVLEEGVADVESIDKLMRSAGFKMGPFELMDLIGIDINLSIDSTSATPSSNNFKAST